MIVSQRWMVAVGLALLIHALMLPFFPHPVVQKTTAVVTVAVHLLHIKPTPKRHRKRPKLVHHIIVKHHSLRIVHVVALPGARAHGKPHHTRIVHRSAAPPRVVMRHELSRPSAKPVVMASTVPTPEDVIGEGTQGSDRVAPIGGSGAGGNADAGSGAAQQGTGNGLGAIPCGVPEMVGLSVRRRSNDLVSADADHNPNLPVTERVMVTVKFPDGSKQGDYFPYLFVYPSHEDDPFDHRNLNNPRTMTLVQWPPAGLNRSTLSPLIRAVLLRTSSEGISLLLPCPGDPQ
jgi:hypothetical protein